MEAQQLFDRACVQLRKQKAQSRGPVKADDGKEYDLPRFHGLEGRKCPVGCLISDDEYDISLEGHNIEDLIKLPNAPPSFLRETKDHLNLMKRLQGVHDHYPVEEWERMLAFTAKTFQLTYTPPNQTNNVVLTEVTMSEVQSEVTQESLSSIMDKCVMPFHQSVLRFLGVDVDLTPASEKPVPYVPVTEEDKRAYAEDQKFIASICTWF